MNTLIVNNRKIVFIQPEQILNMGGPWVCKMHIGEDFKINNVLVDNIITNNNRLYFIRYIERSKWKRDTFFQIYYFDFLSNNVFAYEQHFEIIFIDNIMNNEMVYYEAFHNKDENTKRSILLQPSNWKKYEYFKKKLESPISFRIKLNLPDGKEVLYVNRYEICQGCPEVGKLSIDGKIINKGVFGGPLLYENEFIYVPCFKKKWFNSGFYLSKINLSTLEVSIISEMYEIIDLIKIENSTIYFYDSLEQNETREIPLK